MSARFSNAAAKRWNAVSNIVPISIASIRLLNSYERKKPTSQALSDAGSKVQRFSRLLNGPLRYSTRIFRLGRSSVTRVVNVSRASLNDTVISQITISVPSGFDVRWRMFSDLHSGTNSG